MSLLWIFLMVETTIKLMLAHSQLQIMCVMTLVIYRKRIINSADNAFVIKCFSLTSHT